MYNYIFPLFIFKYHLSLKMPENKDESVKTHTHTHSLFLLRFGTPQRNSSPQTAIIRPTLTPPTCWPNKRLTTRQACVEPLQTASLWSSTTLGRAQYSQLQTNFHLVSKWSVQDRFKKEKVESWLINKARCGKTSMSSTTKQVGLKMQKSFGSPAQMVGDAKHYSQTTGRLAPV